MYEAWYIRHGESTANLGLATFEAAEAPLTERGREQARQVADYLWRRFRRQQVRILTSPYERALATVGATCEYFPGALYDVWPDLHEFDYLALDPTTSTTPAERLPLVRNYWSRCEPAWQAGPAAESFSDFIRRIRKVSQKIHELRQEQPVLVFTHVQVMLAVKWLQSMPMQEPDPLPSEMREFHAILREDPAPNGSIFITPPRPPLASKASWFIDHLSGSAAPR